MERHLFSIAVPSPADLPSLAVLPSGHFACLLAWDAQSASVDTISAFVEHLLRAGASYFVCWGPDCERVHDTIDEITSYPYGEFYSPEDSYIITTWHDSELLRDALCFFLLHSRPDEHYQASTHSSVAIAVGSEAWATEMRAALAEPVRFVSQEPSNGAA